MITRIKQFIKQTLCKACISNTSARENITAENLEAKLEERVLRLEKAILVMLKRLIYISNQLFSEEQQGASINNQQQPTGQANKDQKIKIYTATEKNLILDQLLHVESNKETTYH